MVFMLKFFLYALTGVAGLLLVAFLFSQWQSRQIASRYPNIGELVDVGGFRLNSVHVPRPATAEMRLDVLTGDWISIASARQHRAFLPPAEADPLAPQSVTNPSEVPSRYDVVVFENRSPSFGPETGAVDTGAFGFELRRPARGRCEVVCFSPETEGSFADQTVSRVRTIVEAWAERTRALSAIPGIAGSAAVKAVPSR